jgi:hypothetical protein
MWDKDQRLFRPFKISSLIAIHLRKTCKFEITLLCNKTPWTVVERYQSFGRIPFLYLHLHLRIYLQGNLGATDSSEMLIKLLFYQFRDSRILRQHIVHNQPYENLRTLTRQQFFNIYTKSIRSIEIVILKRQSYTTNLQDWQVTSFGFVNNPSSDFSLSRAVQWNLSWRVGLKSQSCTLFIIELLK